MVLVKQATAEFLAKKRIAVTGVSRTPKDHGANVVYKRLRDRGYQVFAINPNTGQAEGDQCYPDLKSVPGGVEAVVIGTRPENAEATMRECAELGIKHVWMHRGPGAGSVSAAATDYGRQHGITVIDGGCPLMFNPTADAAHIRKPCPQAGMRPRHRPQPIRRSRRAAEEPADAPLRHLVPADLGTGAFKGHGAPRWRRPRTPVCPGR
jgi:predicted CoA-binding protein